MKVGHLTSDDFGGVSTVLYHLLTCSREYGKCQHEAVIADVKGDMVQSLTNRLGHGQYVAVRTARPSRIRWLMRYASDYDVLVVHKTAWYFWLGIYKLLFLWRDRPHFVAVIHDSSLFLPDIAARERLTNWFLRILSKKIIVVRESFKEQIRTTLHRTRGVYYIGNGLPISSTSRHPWSRPTASEFTLLSLSRLDDRAKDVGTILDALYILDDPTYQLSVGGEGSVRVEWEKKTHALSLQSQVEFVGEVADVPAFFRRGNVFVLSSTFHEGTPMVLLEAMLFGLPVIASETAVPRWATENALCFTFKPGNAHELASVLTQFRAIPAREVDELVERAGTYVTNHFNVIRQLEIYEDVLMTCEPANRWSSAGGSSA